MVGSAHHGLQNRRDMLCGPGVHQVMQTLQTFAPERQAELLRRVEAADY